MIVRAEDPPNNIISGTWTSQSSDIARDARNLIFARLGHRPEPPISIGPPRKKTSTEAANTDVNPRPMKR